MSSFILGCDVDITVAPSDKWWLHWLEDVTGVKLALPKNGLSYDLTQYFKTELEYNNLTGYEFWHQEGLYDRMEPVEGSVEALEALVDRGATLVFISHEMGLHGLSKRLWLDKHFPFATTTILTQDVKGFNTKSLVNVDVMIEDRYEGLKEFQYGLTKGVIMNNPYLNPKHVNITYQVADDWKGCYNIVSEYMEGK